MEILEASDRRLTYGWGKVRPRFLQVVNNPKCFLFFLVVFSITQGMLVSGITTMNLQVLEKRYQLTSKDIGLIAASNDISAIILTTFVSFYGTFGSKPKFLGYGSLITGLGALLFALPQLLIGPYQLQGGGSSSALCALNSTAAEGGATTCFSGYGGNWYYLFTFSAAQMIMGAGTTPLYALGPAYLDENVSPKSAPVYLGVFFASALFGPGLGFAVGGSMLEIWVDVTMSDAMDISLEDPRWVGAWWLGYLIGGTFLVLSSVFLFGFPRELPGAKVMREVAIKEGDLPKADKKIKGNVKDILPATLSLLRNPTFMCNTLAITVGSVSGAGLGAFLPKFSQVKYAAGSTQTGVALGLVIMIAGASGIMIGSLVVRRFDLKESCKKSAKYTLIFTVLSSPGLLAWIVPGCSDVSLAGIVKPYHNRSLDSPSLVASCNADCACSQAAMTPVCGADRLVYFSPCHAGCTAKVGQSFTNCSCIVSSTNITGATAKRGFCNPDSSCNEFYVFIVMMMAIIITVFLSAIPNKTVALRSVPDNQRAFALGLQFIFQRGIGFLPGPLLYGALVDSMCTLWGESCGTRGSCQLYDVKNLSIRFTILGVGIRVISTTLYFVSYWFCKPSYDDPMKPGEEPASDEKPKVVCEHENPGFDSTSL